MSKSLQTLREERLQEILDSTHVGLLLIDLQNDFLSPEGKSSSWNHDLTSMQAILPAIERVTDLFRKLGRPIIRTVTYEDPEFRTAAGLDRFLWSEGNNREEDVACLQGSWGAELYVPTEQGDIIIEKKRLSTYKGTRLSDVIRSNDIRTIFVGGIKTQRCVANTVFDLYENEPDLHVVVLEDCVATNDAELQEAMLKEFKNFYPPVLKSTDLLKAWAGSEPVQPL